MEKLLFADAKVQILLQSSNFVSAPDFLGAAYPPREIAAHHDEAYNGDMDDEDSEFASYPTMS